jgi:hypothetical protein
MSEPTPKDIFNAFQAITFKPLKHMISKGVIDANGVPILDHQGQLKQVRVTEEEKQADQERLESFHKVLEYVKRQRQ